ncbi:CRISPR-associated helicase Cas3' [Agathobaculum sp.]|uniref:CRISPR-associated helicase Cas3' n=1 Tax=Agathobaculum sp. TaxID=2048138 RepID=UPI002A839237|nr:CRISPR-associated helicase Cas3' [Agathobaculum sp.]MDY3617582.1 CRISPR-associated helicase Cas3' [Agathobaculum sp.]
MCEIAHSRRDEKGSLQFQPLAAHCRQCAVYASASAPPGMEKTAYLAGLLHDMGKYSTAFQDYLRRAAAGEEVRRGSVNHTFAGARYALERWHTDKEQSFRSLACELVAYAVGAHHGQFDCIALDGADGFRRRLETEGTGYVQARAAFLRDCENEQALDRLFGEAVREVTAACERLRQLADSEQEMLFYLGLLARQTLSAVIEGDRQDTAEYARAAVCGDAPDVCWDTLLTAFESRLAAFSDTGDINQARKRISDCCRAAADRGGGVFRLNVPTGGGKTLASLRYALAAAALGGERIFFVIPLLSVLEQNAKVIRDWLSDDELILEHHSNAVRENTVDGELDENELLLENWRAPVVVTTLVQLLNTLLAGRTSCIRRMGALRGSVIVIDEVQSVPRNLLSEFNLAMNYLVGFCGASVVLCSATQPCLEQAAHRLRYAEQPELVPQDESRTFHRTEFISRLEPPGFTVEELADFAASQAEANGSLLLICNTRTQARALYAAMRSRWRGQLFHLSNAMCMAHRIPTIDKIKQALAGRGPVVCVSTQLVEAGVDFSFGCVIRVLAGLDNLIQSAGRCNRSGELGGVRPVYIVRLQCENLSHLKEIAQSQQAMASVLLQFARDPETFGNDLSGAVAVRAYYQTLYAEMKQGAQDYPLPGGGTLLDLLSLNSEGRGHCAAAENYLIGQAFATAGQAFHVFDDAAVDVLVPYGGGAALIASLGSPQAGHDLAYRFDLFRQTGAFSIPLYQYEVDRLRERGGVYPLCEGAVLALRPEFYSDQTGFSPEGDVNIFLEV